MVFEDCHNMTLRGCTASCPSCGGTGRIPDGIYDVLGETIRILRSSDRSASQLQKLADALKAARQNNASPDEIKQTIKEQAPELTGIADLLPTNRNELYGAVSAICAILSVLIAGAALYLSAQAITPEQVDEIIARAMNQPVTPKQSGTPSSNIAAPQSPHVRPASEPSGMNRHQRRAHAKRARHK
jgi:hypothetical protein